MPPGTLPPGDGNDNRNQWNRTMKTHSHTTRAGRVTRYGFSVGGIERVGEHVSIVQAHGALIVRRHPAHPAGWYAGSCRTIREARRMAAAARRGESPERRDW